MTDTPPELIVEAAVTKRWPIGALELRKARQQQRIGFYLIGRRHYYTPAQIAAYLTDYKLKEAPRCQSPALPPYSRSAPIGSNASPGEAGSTATGLTQDLEESAVVSLQASILNRQKSSSLSSS